MTKKSPRQDGKAKTRHLTLLLMRKELTSPEAALKEPRDLETLALPADFEFAGSLHLLKPPPREPRWAPFLREGFAEDVQFTLSTNAAAVLFVQTSARLFAVTFA
jgi:uncharacterized protein (TIGR04141 family)